MKNRSRLTLALATTILLLCPVAFAQGNYTFTSPNKPGILGYTFQSDPYGIITHCPTSPAAGWCVGIWQGGVIQPVTFNVTAPASASGTTTGNGIQLGAASFNITTSGAGTMYVFISNGDKNGAPDPGVTSCLGGSEGFVCATNGLMAVPAGSNGNFQVNLNLRFKIDFPGSSPITASFGLTFFWSLVPDVQTGDLAITYIQPIQVVHNFPPPLYAGPPGTEYKHDEMPLISGKTTMVRVWIKNIGNNPMPIKNVTAVLHGYVTGPTADPPDPLLPVSKPFTAQPYTGPLPLQSPPDYDEPTVDFYLPQYWANHVGPFNITVEIVAPSGFNDSDMTNNSVTRFLVLEKQPSGPNAAVPGRLRIGWVPICQRLPAGGTACPSDNIGNYWDKLVKLFPVADGGVDFFRVDNQVRVYPTLVQSGTQYARMLATYLRPLKASLEENDLAGFDFLIGFLVDTTRPGPWGAATVAGACPDAEPGKPPENPPCLPGGQADAVWIMGSGQVALITDNGLNSDSGRHYSDFAVAHEIGHLMGLVHVAVKTVGKGNVGTGGCDDNSAYVECSNWPYTDPSIQFTGYDTTVYRKHPASSNYDVMSYCSDADSSNMWIAPYTFRKLFNNNLAASDAYQDSWNSCKISPDPLPNGQPKRAVTEARTSQPNGSAARPSVAQDLAIVTGTVQADRSGATLSPIFHVRTKTLPSNANPGGDYCLQFADAGGTSLGNFCFRLSFNNPETTLPMTNAGFSHLVVLPDGTVSVTLTNKGSAIARVSGGSQPPSVSIQSPQPGEDWSTGTHTLAWSVTSAGSVQPAFMVAYSSDNGATWSPISAPIADTQYTIDPATLIGGSNVLFRVTASDGVLNGVATAGPITIAQSPSASLPAGPVDFRNGLAGVAVRRDLVLSNTGTGPLHVSSIDFDRPEFALVTPRPPFDIYPGSPLTLKLTFTARAAGPVSGHMTVSSSDASKPALAIDLKGNGITALTSDAAVTPDKVDFGTTALGTSVNRTVTLQSFGPAALTVNSVAVSGAGFSLPALPGSFELAVNDTKAIVLQFSPQHSGAHTGTLTIMSDDPVHGTITVALTGNAPTTGPSISVNPPSLDFGTINVGQTSPAKTITVTNSGAASATVTLAASGPFAVSPSSLTVAANGGTGTASVTYKPTATGPSTASLPVTISGQPTPVASVSLTGTGANATSSDVVLKIDGGQFDNEVGYPAGAAAAYFLNRLTPPSYPATIKSVQIFFSTRDDGLKLNTPLTILSATNSTVTPTTLALNAASTDRVAATVSALDQFITYTVPSRTITSGDFVIGFTVANAAGIYPADQDQLTPSQARSYTSKDGVTFALLDSISPDVAGNLAIRAVVSVGTGNTNPAPAITISPTSLNFGTVVVGQISQAKTITITNTGTASATVNLTTSAPFAVFPTSLTLSANGGAGTASVIFNPITAGPSASSINIILSGQSTPVAQVSVTGASTAPGGGPAGSCVAPPANLVSWWPGEGNANDLTGGNNGTLQGGASLAAGKVGQAFQFDGNAGYVSIGNPANLRLTSAITLEAWINPHAAPPGSASSGTNMAAVLTKWAQKSDATSDSDSYGLWLRANGSALTMFTAIHQSGTGEPSLQGGTIPLNAWSHLAMTFDSTSGQFVLYVNGQAVASANSPGAIAATSRNVLIGREDSVLPRPFNGLIDEVSIYGRALSASEIQSIFNAGSTGKCKAGAP